MGRICVSVALLLLTVRVGDSYYNQLDGFSEYSPNDFETDKGWSYVNFTWPSYQAYTDAIYTGKYIPENVAMAGIKIYGSRLYIALPRIRPGSPVTLAYVELDGPTYNQLLRPFPSWEMNAQNDCSTLQNVQSMEIDTNGIMWVLDGFRVNQMTSCPPKLVLLDLNKNRIVIHTYIVDNHISLAVGGFMNDIVIDETDGGFAYITDASPIDPGLIIYSKERDHAWKIRDISMYGEAGTDGFYVDGLQQNGLVPIDGIALSPVSHERYVYYCALTGKSLFAISTSILKNETLCQTYSWRSSVFYVGDKGQSDGLAIDNQGNLFFGLLSTYGVGKWNVYQPFSTAEVIAQDEKTFIWTDSFCFDNRGSVYLLNNGINKYFDQNYPLEFGFDIKFRIVKWYTGTVSYLARS